VTMICRETDPVAAEYMENYDMSPLKDMEFNLSIEEINRHFRKLGIPLRNAQMKTNEIGFDTFTIYNRLEPVFTSSYPNSAFPAESCDA
jgi:hypothetical protein